MVLPHPSPHFAHAPPLAWYRPGSSPGVGFMSQQSPSRLASVVQADNGDIFVAFGPGGSERTVEILDEADAAELRSQLAEILDG